jgi:voltage-gated potassium channel
MTMNRPSRITGSYNLERWERWAEWPLAGVAAIFLVVYSVQVLAQPRDLTKTLLEWFL